MLEAEEIMNELKFLNPQSIARYPNASNAIP